MICFENERYLIYEVLQTIYADIMSNKNYELFYKNNFKSVKDIYRYTATCKMDIIVIRSESSSHIK